MQLYKISWDIPIAFSLVLLISSCTFIVCFQHRSQNLIYTIHIILFGAKSFSFRVKSLYSVLWDVAWPGSPLDTTPPALLFLHPTTPAPSCSAFLPAASLRCHLRVRLTLTSVSKIESHLPQIPSQPQLLSVPHDTYVSIYGMLLIVFYCLYTHARTDSSEQFLFNSLIGPHYLRYIVRISDNSHVLDQVFIVDSLWI